MPNESGAAVEMSNAAKNKHKPMNVPPPDILAGEPHKHKRIIYLGPTVKDGEAFSLKFGSIFSNGLPPEVSARVEADEHLAELFVATDKTAVASAVRSLADGDSVLSAAKKHVIKKYAHGAQKARR